MPHAPVRRDALRAAAAELAAACGEAHAQPCPSRPVRLVVPWPAGRCLAEQPTAPGNPVGTVTKLVAAAKARPDAISVAVTTTTPLATFELFKQQAGAPLLQLGIDPRGRDRRRAEGLSARRAQQVRPVDPIGQHQGRVSATWGPAPRHRAASVSCPPHAASRRSLAAASVRSRSR